MHRRYLRGKVDGKCLIYKNNSSYKSICYGSYRNDGNIGSFGNYGNIVGSFYIGYVDVKIWWFDTGIIYVKYKKYKKFKKVFWGEFVLKSECEIYFLNKIYRKKLNHINIWMMKKYN